MTAPIPRKQSSSQEQWLAAVAEMAADLPATRARAELLVEIAADRLRRTVPAGEVAYGWSGGKDSQALRAVAEAAGFHESVLVLTNLEYPEMVSWCTSQMPDGLTVVKRPWDLSWLAAHPKMLFPDDAATASKWFAGVQHWGQRRFVKEHKLTHLLMGRRVADGNYVGPGGVYEDRDGFVRVSPIADWSHEDVLAVCVGLELPLAPCYGWPRGYRVGTGPWPQRQWCADHQQGWAETYAIDPDVVLGAATMIPEAERFIESLGKT